MLTFQDLIRSFQKTLAEAQELREVKSGWVSENELEWMVYELEVMLKITNEERAKRDKAPITMKDIQMVERWASGHVDYTHKFALYCAGFAIGQMPVQ
jgi:hypothetical protein